MGSQLQKQKSDLEKLDSVLAYNRAQADTAARNKTIARDKRALELAELEQQYLLEISRLLMVRDGLIRQIRESEQVIIALSIMRKRRFRVAA